MMLSLPCVAQRKDSVKGNRAEWKKELQDFKYKYLAQEVELTEEQQEKFFELYVKMESELKTVDSDCKAAQKAVKAEGEHSDAEYEKALNALLNKRVMKGQIEKRYYDQFKTFLSVKQLYKLTLIYTVSVGLLATLVFELFPLAVTGLFGTPANIPNPGDYWVFAEKTFRIFLSLIVFNCFQKMTSIFLQFCGYPVHSIVASTIRDLVIFVPLVIILPMFFGVEGILFAGPAADLIAGLLSVAMTVSVFKRIQ